MSAELVDLLKQFIEIPSPTGEEAAMSRAVAGTLQKRGYRVIRQQVTKERENIVALTGARPTVLFCTHLDTVPPHRPLSETGSLLYGRGACDAKGPLVAMIGAGDQLRHQGIDRFGFLFVVGEELESDGARKAAELELDSSFVIVGEPTENRLAVAQKGTLVFRANARGQAGHSADPSFGSSAIHSLVRLASTWLDRHWGNDPQKGETTLNLGLIQGGSASNVIAAEASVTGIFRISTSTSAVKQKLRESLFDDVSLEVLSASEPIELGKEAGFETFVAAFGSDAPYLTSLGEVFMIGPGSLRHAHRDDEQLNCEEFYRGVEDYFRLAVQLLQR